MGLERLPSGKFDTNYLVCQMACVAMNLLRLIGVHTLHGEDAPVRHNGEDAPVRHNGIVTLTPISAISAKSCRRPCAAS